MVCKVWIWISQQTLIVGPALLGYDCYMQFTICYCVHQIFTLDLHENLDFVTVFDIASYINLYLFKKFMWPIDSCDTEKAAIL